MGRSTSDASKAIPVLVRPGAKGIITQDVRSALARCAARTLVAGGRLPEGALYLGAGEYSRHSESHSAGAVVDVSVRDMSPRESELLLIELSKEFATLDLGPTSANRAMSRGGKRPPGAKKDANGDWGWTRHIHAVWLGPSGSGAPGLPPAARKQVAEFLARENLPILGRARPYRHQPRAGKE